MVDRNEVEFAYEEDYANRVLVCSSNQRKEPLILSANPMHPRMVVFSTPKGKVPQQLSGSYTNFDTARQAYEEYILTSPKSKVVHREEFLEARKQTVAKV